MKVFFYGLFMDADLLSKKGIIPHDICVAHVDGFRLRIGERATLQRTSGAKAHGVVMEISSDEAEGLYAQGSVADYVAETITAIRVDGNAVEAQCYNLPKEKITGTNQAYAQSLLEVAQRIGLPDAYLSEIREADK